MDWKLEKFLHNLFHKIVNKKSKKKRILEIKSIKKILVIRNLCLYFIAFWFSSVWIGEEKSVENRTDHDEHEFESFGKAQKAHADEQAQRAANVGNQIDQLHLRTLFHTRIFDLVKVDGEHQKVALYESVVYLFAVKSAPKVGHTWQQAGEGLGWKVAEANWRAVACEAALHGT